MDTEKITFIFLILWRAEGTYYGGVGGWRGKISFSGSVSLDKKLTSLTVCAALVIRFIIGNFISSNFNRV